MKPGRLLLSIAAALGFTAVALGAFGAHALKEKLEAVQRMETWKTAVDYHLAHAVALLAVALAGEGRIRVAWCWTAGTALFSGSLYLVCLTGVGRFGAITPVGGVLLLAGWFMLLFPARREA